MSAIIVGGKFINPEKLEAKLIAAFKTWTRFDVNDYFQDEFTQEKWEYPGETRRKSGELAGPGPRDIYDLGVLYKSGRDGFSIAQGGTDVTASWNWNAQNSRGRAYAWYVHEGFSTNQAPRQWTDVFQQKDLFLVSNVSKALLQRIRATMGR